MLKVCAFLFARKIHAKKVTDTGVSVLFVFPVLQITRQSFLFVFATFLKR